jgi:hypothetical protein
MRGDILLCRSHRPARIFGFRVVEAGDWSARRSAVPRPFRIDKPTQREWAAEAAPSGRQRSPPGVISFVRARAGL